MMITEKHLQRSIDSGEISIDLYPVGDDIAIIIKGGSKPHIGCTVMSVPRPSLSGERASCTSSVLNCTGHKDEHICRIAAEAVCVSTGSTVVCSGGFHTDRLTAQDIESVLKTVKEMVREIC